MAMEVDVSVDFDEPEKIYAVKIQTDLMEINVWIPIADTSKLQHVRRTPWVNGALRIGVSASSPAFWCVDDDMLSILVGPDDQTWDIAVSFPVNTIDKILDEIEKLADK